MLHGIQSFFEESGRARRRVSLLALGTGVAMVAPLVALQIPSVQQAVQSLPEPMRFGFAGRNQVVAVVHLDGGLGVDESLRDLGQIQPKAAGGGRGDGEPQKAPTTRPPEHTGPRLTGLGENTQDLITRALSTQGRVPMFLSDELIIVRMVRPEYPEEVRARGVEGKVAVLALIDTLGGVADAEVMAASGEPQLDRAAEKAVRQCRFRPYQEKGATREVYAVFRFAFRIY